MMGQKGDLKDLIRRYRLQRKMQEELKDKDDIVWVYTPDSGYDVRPKKKRRENMISVSKLTIFQKEFIEYLLRRKAEKKKELDKEYDKKIERKESIIRDLPNEVKTSDKIKETKKEIEILKEQLRLLQAKADLEYEKEMGKMMSTDEEELEKEAKSR
jgi:polyhydroxyalkanoate synthesis regulator phasin